MGRLTPGAHTAAHRFFAAGLLFLGIAAATYGTLQVTLGPRPVVIHVRWAPGVVDTIRQEAAQRYSLSQEESLDGRTWRYALNDPSRANVRALVSDAVIEDTSDIDRTTFRVSPSAPRLSHPPASHPWIPVGLRGVTVLCLFVGLICISLGFIERAAPGAVKEAIAQFARHLTMPLLLILFGSALLRLANLGYSHFQGDEVKALFPASAAFPDFLLGQGKGPGQFLVTWLVRAVTGVYVESVTRLPFAMASLAAVPVVFLFTRECWGRGPALLAAALIGSCGLIVGFGRIVQYQSFCMLFVLLTAWPAFAFVRSGAPVQLYAAAVPFGLGLLFHYDALTFCPTLGLLVAVGCWRHRDRLQRLAPHLAAALLLGVAIAGVFYVPYTRQPGFSDVADYLTRRVIAGRGMDTFARTGELLSLYLPPFYLVVMVLFGLVGVAALIRRRDVPSWALIFWFATIFVFYMLLGGDPRSHVYNFFLPGLIIAAYGMWHVVDRAGARRFVQTAIWILVAAYGGMTWQLFVDHAVEHPWYRKTIVGYPLPNLETRQVEGVFGFPYVRGLDAVGQLFDAGQLSGTFDSNERDVMADFYFHSRRGSPPDYYVYVHQPLSLERGLPQYVRQSYQLAREVSVNGRKTIDIYEIVPGARRQLDPPPD